MQKRYFETDQKRFRDFEILPKIFRDPRFSRYHSPPLNTATYKKPKGGGGSLPLYYGGGMTLRVRPRVKKC